MYNPISCKLFNQLEIINGKEVLVLITQQKDKLQLAKKGYNLC